jgi:antirestriction protein ArdC
MSKADIQQIVTDNIIAAMEKGIVPWRKPWNGHGSQVSLTTGKPYRGINTLILDSAQMSAEYELPLWGTFKQISAMGGKVLKGEKGTPVVLWKPMEREDEDGNVKSFMLMRYFTVFNVAQTEGLEIPEKFLNTREPVPVLDGVADALAYGPEVRHLAQDRAYYEPAKDRITLPTLEQFVSAESYAATALHELAHSTGHESRLGRFDGSPVTFGCETYAQEELVAELGAAMLATALGIDVEWSQHAAYLSSWLKALKADRGLLIGAAQKAQKAVDLVMVSMVAEEMAA